MKKIITIVAVLAVVAVAVAGFVAYSFFKTPEAASGPIEAIPVGVQQEEAAAPEAGDETGTQVDADTQAEPAAEVAAEEAESTEPQAETEAVTETGADTEVEPEVVAETAETDANADAQPEAESAAGVSSDTNQAAVEASASPLIFEIIPAESEARFLIGEVLRGDPITVVGTTDQVAAQFAVDPNNLPAVEVGPIQVNARTLATDNDFRNRAIKNRILLTDAYEFVTFTPTELVGLPEAGTVGETYTFQIVGDLTITDVTRQVTFDVTATATSANRIEAIASTTILYSDFGLTIPAARVVDSVEDEVRLELEFVAEAI